MSCVGGRIARVSLGRALAAWLSIFVLLAWDGTHRPGNAQPGQPQFELSTGAETAQQSWAVYSTLTMAPFGGLYSDGLRLRASGGYGAYSYSGLRDLGAGSQLLKFAGTVSFGDILIGYHRQVGPLTLKVFAGGTVAQHVLSPLDPEADVHGLGFGAKGVVETWWTLSEQAWAQLDLSYGTLHESFAGRLRLGWRLLPPLSVGLEAGTAGNVDGETGRIGGFLRYEWDGGELSVSAGVMTDWAGIEKLETQDAFATISWLNRF